MHRLPLLLSTLLSALPAQEPEGGPPVGQPLPPCTVYAASGPMAGQEFDVAARIGNGPGALLFVHELNRNTGPVIGGLDRLAVEFGWTGLQTFTVLLAGDRNDGEATVKRSSAAMGMHRPMLVTVDGAEGPGGYALARKGTLTLVLANEGRVHKSVTLVDTGRNDLPRLRALLEEVTGPVPTEPEALARAIEQRASRDPEILRAQLLDLLVAMQRDRDRAQNAATRRPNPRMQRDGAQPEPAAATEAEARPREGRAPEDEELRTLLRRAIQRAADKTELDAVFTAIETRAGTSAALKDQTVEMFKLMLSLEYGNDDARARARAFLDRNK